VDAGLGWLMLVFCERKTLLVGWFKEKAESFGSAIQRHHDAGTMGR